MNIFYFYDKDETNSFQKSAQAQPDKMLVKMPLETAQMLCTAHRVLDGDDYACLLYTSPSPRDRTRSRMPSSA